MSDEAAPRLLAVSRLLAVVAGLLAGFALGGYALDRPAVISLGHGLQGMSPLTAAALLALAAGTFAVTRRVDRVARWCGGVAGLIGVLTLLSNIFAGDDHISPGLTRTVFGAFSHEVGRTSVATALCLLLLSGALFLPRTRPRASDAASGCSLVIAGMALLGYLYGVQDLYALPLFNSMALNTAAALFLLSMATVMAQPERGWAALLASNDAGGSTTRRQLAFTIVPVLVGYMLLWATDAHSIGPGIAMALLVITTVVPLGLLILRDGHALNALTHERKARFDIQERLTQTMAEELARQRDLLALEAAERMNAEAALSRAQRMEAVGQLTGGIAHDFNNLLMAVRGNLDLLQRRFPSDDQRLRRYLDNAITATDKGAKVTAQLLAFSRSQRLQIRPTEVDLCLRNARELIGTSLGPNIRIETSLESEGVWVETDPDQLDLAILNLAVNARDAMPEGGTLRITSHVCRERLPGAETEQRYVAVAVSDNGSGMAADILAKAVEPFFTTKERGKGTGLGLAQVYGFIRQCGGDLRITSTPGAGTTIEMLLRVVEPNAKPDVGKAATVTNHQIGAPGRQVLVIDDDTAVRAVIVDALQSIGFEVVEAPDGPQGLDLLQRTRPDAAVIDFLMPGMNGAEVARLAQQYRPGLPIIFVSGYSDTVALDSIADAVVIRKPFKVDDLSRALAAVLPA